MPSPSPHSEPPPTPLARRRAAQARREYAETLVPAILLALLLHFALIRAIPASGIFAGPAPMAGAVKPVTVIAAAPDTVVPANLLPPAMRPAPPKLVEVNPQAPSAKPDHTRRTGAADQRSAQPEPAAPKAGDTPRLRGDTPDSTRLSQNIPREFLPEALRPRAGQPVGRDTAPAEPADTRTPGKPAAEPAKNLPGPDSPTDRRGPRFAPNPAPKPAPAADKTADKTTGQTARPPAPVALGTPAADGDTPKPRPRPKASLAGTSGPLGVTTTAANEHGVLANDSVFSRMGEYSARFYEIIQAAWWAGIDRSRVNETGTVVVEFTLHRDGTVTGAHIVEASTSDRAALLCLDAVIGRAPFDKWPEDMVGIYGEKQEGRLTFHYR